MLETSDFSLRLATSLEAARKGHNNGGATESTSETSDHQAASPDEGLEGYFQSSFFQGWGSKVQF